MPMDIIQYANGNTKNGNIPCTGTYAWKIVKVLDEYMEVVELN